MVHQAPAARGQDNGNTQASHERLKLREPDSEDRCPCFRARGHGRACPAPPPARGSARAAGGDGGHPEGNQQLAGGLAAGVRGDSGKRDTPVRRAAWRRSACTMAKNSSIVAQCGAKPEFISTILAASLRTRCRARIFGARCSSGTSVHVADLVNTARVPLHCQLDIQADRSQNAAVGAPAQRRARRSA